MLMVNLHSNSYSLLSLGVYCRLLFEGVIFQIGWEDSCFIAAHKGSMVASECMDLEFEFACFISLF